MSTTLSRIRTALEVASTRTSWSSYNELATSIRDSRPSDFRIRGDGSVPADYMSEDSIERLLEFATDLKLFSTGADGTITTTDAGRRCLESEDRYRRQVRTATKSYLERHSLDLAYLESEIGKVKLPNVPDADTLHSRVAKKTDLSEDELRRALFLLAKADGIARVTKVHYRLGS